MPFSKIATLATAVAFASKVACHGTVTGIVADGVYYQGYSANFQYMAAEPVVVGWSTPQNQGNGPITPDAYATSDIICHLGATNAQTSAKVAAGGTVELQWTAWPESHHGPVIDYLAPCSDGDCKTVDKTTLEFFKIDGVGLIDDTTVPGTWADDQLIANNNTWAVTIPSDIAPGHYVLRHEIIALHSAGETNGAQNYPQCFNLEVTGSGTATPSGTLGTALYTADEAGILVNIYQTIASYLVPGPALYSGAANSSESAVPAATTVAGEVPSSSAAPTSVVATSTLPVSAGIIAPAGSYPTGAPYSNSTATRTKKTKSACKAKTKASTAVSVPTFASSVTIPTASSTPTAGSDESSSTIAKSATTSSATSSKIPSGTTLDTVLAWIASFYTEHKDTAYSGASVARRQHARAIIPRRVPQ
ncbi:hypothetical protein GLAREA_06121 [Glarea lozoyensis ATCC 20868]|uniref:Auxiliary Activity family 9 catalytic domain-containing protein n=1 Tax=Glarea lozoyensis (strain ATCC 20868 / MF5171) TaxID=1116229 RepID=S3D7K8_GLAL2|nr:uncharacterized protein GLAREA_06121 [Glarea lozoyensis ATCC 20868]EPE33109.1 hypothetical protein GLAREA_06121 [Glarea lozoyensis ATCC 20868]